MLTGISLVNLCSAELETFLFTFSFAWEMKPPHHEEDEDVVGVTGVESVTFFVSCPGSSLDGVFCCGVFAF
jgi:hypothetical protein